MTSLHVLQLVLCVVLPQLLFVGAIRDPAGHSPLIGYAFDGFPIYGPFTDGGALPTDLDVCNGRSHSTLGYIYHTTPTAPYTIGCFRGQVLCSTVNNVAGCVTTFSGTAGDNDGTHSCTDINAKLTTGFTPQQVSWTVVADNVPTTRHCSLQYCPVEAAYRWLTDGATTSLGLTSDVSCADGAADGVLIVSSNGIPDHNVGSFPMDHAGGTTGLGGPGDNPNTIVAQSFSWRIPRYPKLKATPPSDNIITNVNALPMGPIGFALNGVPFFNAFNNQLEDAVDADSEGYEVMDMCLGHPTGQGQYHYHSIPWCTFNETADSWTTLRAALALDAAECSDHRRNGDETDTDCGGTCPQRCSLGDRCQENLDCASGVCNAGTGRCYNSDGSAPAPSARRPNVVVILVDDLGWNDVGFHATDLTFATPAIDRLVEEGVELQQAYVSPTCTPSRAGLLTGRYPERFGLASPIGPKMRHGLPLGEVTIGQEFQALGYNTGWVGKWHLGMWAEEALPWRRGFNRTYGFVSAGGETYTTKIAGEGGADEFFDLRDQGSIVTNATEIATYNTELFAAKAAQFIEDSVTQGNDPFFLYYAMQNVHAPVEYPDTYFSNTPCKDVVNENRGKYCALLRAADAGIATVMDTLRRLGIDDDTIVVLSSDNGGAPSYGGYNTPLKGSKGTTWEGGVRAVAAVWAPGHLPAAAAGTVYEGVVHVTDWMPTLLRRAGWSRQAECNTAKPLDGVDVWPAIVENVTSPRTEVIHYYDPEEGGTRSLRSGRYKLVVNASDNRGDQWTSPPATVNTPGTPSTGASGLMRLFDVEEDATETTNLWDTLPSVRDTMLARLEEIGSTIVLDTCAYTFCGDAASVPAATAAGAWTSWVDSSEAFQSSVTCAGSADYKQPTWRSLPNCDMPQCDTCDSGMQDNEETDVDCGGPYCTKCAVGKACELARDCASGTCEGGVCVSSGHSPKIGYALDGFPIYGPYSDGGMVPTDLDVCNGRTHPALGYIYHVTATPPYTIGCFRGEFICTSTQSLTGCVTAGSLTGSAATGEHTCSDLEAELAGVPGRGQQGRQAAWSVAANNVPSTLHCSQRYCPTNAAYSWDTSTATMLATANSVACQDPAQANAISITSNGLPGDVLGDFPLDYAGGTLGASALDCAFDVSAQSHEARMPRYPKLRTPAPTVSVTTDRTVLPSSGKIGVALNGVPIYTAFDDTGADMVSGSSAAYQVTDLCGGRPRVAGGEYVYRSMPWCLFNDTAANSVEALKALGLPQTQCSDGVQNGDETGTDCGGQVCGACPISCSSDSDCAVGCCDGSVCSDSPTACGPCSSTNNPCHNNGTCTVGGNNAALCDCSTAPGYVGKVCNMTIATFMFPLVCADDWSGESCSMRPPCYNNSLCEHGSTCEVTSSNQETCNCGATPAWVGKYCNISVESLLSHVVCADGWSGPSCNVTSDPTVHLFHLVCADGYSGQACSPTDDCLNNDACKNGGTCVDGDNTFTCDCSGAPGWAGDHCDEDADDCSPNPCSNGGTCSDTGTQSFSCACSDGWRGATCSEVDDCHGDPCANGGSCEDIGSTHNCTCTGDWFGSTCSSIDCVMSAWGAWDECGGGGNVASCDKPVELQSRTRSVERQSAGDGAACGSTFRDRLCQSPSACGGTGGEEEEEEEEDVSAQAVVVTLDLDYDDYLPGTPAREQLVLDYIESMAALLNISASRIVVRSVSRGSVKIDTVVKAAVTATEPGATITPKAVVSQLKKVLKAVEEGEVNFTAPVLAAVVASAELQQSSVGECGDGSYDASCLPEDPAPEDPTTGLSTTELVIIIVVAVCAVAAIGLCAWCWCAKPCSSSSSSDKSNRRGSNKQQQQQRSGGRRGSRRRSSDKGRFANVAREGGQPASRPVSGGRPSNVKYTSNTHVQQLRAMEAGSGPGPQGAGVAVAGLPPQRSQWQPQYNPARGRGRGRGRGPSQASPRRSGGRGRPGSGGRRSSPRKLSAGRGRRQPELAPIR